MYKYILFDLDGTLTDSCEGITKSVEYALKKLSVEVKSRDELLGFIGPPLRYSFKKFYGMSDSEAQSAIKLYRERFSTVGLYELKVYDGVYDMLEALKQRGRTLVLATSKPEVFTRRILEKFELIKYFDIVVGSELDGSRETKGEVIREALRQLGNPDRNDVIMVGDRHFDVEGAKENEIACIGVQYGFAEEGELISAGAVKTVNTVSELTEVL